MAIPHHNRLVADLSRLDPKRTALVIIDLQAMMLQRNTQPYSAAEVLAKSAELADAVRASGGLVVCVALSFNPDLRDRLTQTTDSGIASGEPPAGYDVIAPELRPESPGTIIVRKRQWGAFYGTDLEMQLRRRGIDSVILTGISTNIGIESTARDAYERGFQLYFVKDAMATSSNEEHAYPVQYIFPRLGHVCTYADARGKLIGD